MKFRAENIPFFISPVYPVPPIRIIFFVKFNIAKLDCRVPSSSGIAIKLGTHRMCQSGISCDNSSFDGLKNMLYANKLDHGVSVTTLMFMRYSLSAHA